MAEKKPGKLTYQYVNIFIRVENRIITKMELENECQVPNLKMSKCRHIKYEK